MIDSEEPDVIGASRLFNPKDCEHKVLIWFF